MKKILFVFPFAIVGGVETLFATLFKNLPAGYEYIPILPIGINENWVKCNIKNPMFYNAHSLRSDLAVKIDTIKPNLIVSAIGYNLSKALAECKQSYPVVETSHNVLGSAHDSIKILHKHIVHVVSVSKSVHSHISKVWVGPSTIILTGIDTDKFRPNKDMNPFVKNYAYFGRLSNADKYVRDLFRAFTKMPGVTLNVYGEAHTPREQAEYVKWIKTDYSSATIHLKGFVPNPEHHIPLNDVVVIRSEAEGFCNTAAEAFACGVPLVAWNFGGVLDHAPERACLKAKTQAEFENHLRIVKTFSLRRDMREAGLQFVQSECNAKVMSQGYFKLFKSLLGQEEIVVNSTKPSKVAAICTQFSDSIQHSMEQYADETILVPYGEGLKSNVVNTNADKVIVNAAGNNYKQLIIALSKTKKVYTLYHGSFCSFSFDFFAGELHNLQTMLDLTNAGYIQKIGFINEGSALFYEKLGYRSMWTPNIPMEYVGSTKKGDSINIGVFSAPGAFKNTATALSCALAIPNATVHTIYQITTVPGISKERVIVHGKQTKANLLKLLGEMDVTLMLSFSESYGMLVTQSFAMGTPCVVGPACLPLLAPEHKGMYVERLDDAHKIIEAIEYCLSNKFNFKPQIDQLRSIAIKQREEFLS